MSDQRLQLSEERLMHYGALLGPDETSTYLGDKIFVGFESCPPIEETRINRGSRIYFLGCTEITLV